jgi:hypothetical protein
MNPRTVPRLCAAVALAAGGVLVSAQTFTPMPQTPRRAFGASVTPAIEGWYDNPNGTHSFLIGYFSRNTEAAVDIPIGPDNHFEPGDPDRGQPTHFLPNRRYGMFVVTEPKEFDQTKNIAWTLAANGQTVTIPLHMPPDYNISPFRSSQQGPHGSYNLPPVLRFDAKGPTVIGPVANPANAISRTARVNEPMVLDLWADDDALTESATSVPVDATKPLPPVTVSISKYRGLGDVVFGDEHPKMETLKGGKPEEPYSGKASTTVKFGQPGDYMLHVVVNDYSGFGGGSNCCWTNAIVKVRVAGASQTETSPP